MQKSRRGVLKGQDSLQQPSGNRARDFYAWQPPPHVWGRGRWALRERTRATCSAADLVAEAARSGEQGAVTVRGSYCSYALYLYCGGVGS